MSVLGHEGYDRKIASVYVTQRIHFKEKIQENLHRNLYTGEGALLLVQLPISFVISCFEMECYATD